jgi:hypothetical protein
MDRQLTEIEKAFHDARLELINAAQRTYEGLRRELDKLTARAAKTAERVNELGKRLQEQAQTAVTEGSKAASTQAKRMERALADARKELDAVSKDQQWLKHEAARAYDYLRRVSGIDKAVAAVEKEWAKRTGATGRKSAARKATARRKPAAKKRPATRTAASKKKATSRKKAPARKKAASTKKAASKKKAASTRKVTPSRKKAPARKKTTASKKKATASRKKTGASKKKTQAA